jgi:transposase InsO family protein
LGYQLIADELRDSGVEVCDNTVHSGCKEIVVFASFHKRSKSRKPGPPVHDDLVKRDFTASEPNRLWLTDITEHQPSESKLYVCSIKDLFSNRIAGYATDNHIAHLSRLKL